jgi:hypothetical protein
MRRYKKGKEILKKGRKKEKHNIQEINLFGFMY